MKSIFVTPALCAIGLVIFAAGCGGGSASGASVSPGAGDHGPRSATTATFHVDVASGEVTVTPNKPVSRAIFAGSAITFKSSLLLDQPGTVGLKTLAVSLTNNFGLPIGESPSGTTTGLKVIFGNFVNVSAFSDLRTKTSVSTFAGSGSSTPSNGSLLGAGFNGPTGIVAAGGGVFYVADKAGNTIRKISGGNVSTVAGSATAGSANGEGSVARFNFPFGIAQNPVDGALIVTDLLNNRVRRVTTDGRVTTVCGTGAATSTDGSGSSATTYGPTGVAVDSSGTIYIVEIYGQRVRKIVLSGSNPALPASYTVSTVAGNGTTGATDGSGTGATFNAPTGLTVSPDGSLYVCEQGNNLIRRVTPNGDVNTIAGTGVASSIDGPGTTATFNSPRGIVYSGDALFVTDRLGNRIRQLTLSEGASPAVASNWNVASLAGTGGSGYIDGKGDVAQINQPQMIAADSSGNLFAPDVTNRIREVVPSEGSFPIGTPSGTPPTELVQLSNPDGTIPTSASLSGVPYITYAGAVASGAASGTKNWNFIVPAGVTAFEFTTTVEADTTALTPPEGGSGAASSNVSVRTLTGGGSHLGYLNGPLSSARFNGPEYLAVDNAGNIYAADQYNSAIRRIGVDGNVSTVAGDGTTPSFADGAGNTAAFSYPSGIAVSPDGFVVYVADTVNNRIRRIAFFGGDVTNSVSWSVSTIAGTGAAGGTYTTALGNVATFNSPIGLAMDGGGNLYVSESAGNRIRRIQFLGGSPSTSSNWRVSLVAGDVSGAAGASGSTDGNQSSARFKTPNSIACDRTGNLYVADTGNHRIRFVSIDGTTTTLAGGVSGDTPVSSYVDGTGAAAHFQSPSGITVDSSGLVFVSDSSGNRIRCITPGGKVTTVAGTGTTGTADGIGSAATFNSPASLAVTSSGTLYVGSVNDNGIRVVERIISAGTR